MERRRHGREFKLEAIRLVRDRGVAALAYLKPPPLGRGFCAHAEMGSLGRLLVEHAHLDYEPSDKGQLMQPNISKSLRIAGMLEAPPASPCEFNIAIL